MTDISCSQTPVSRSPTSKSSSSPSKDNRSESSSKEKKILPGRRQQRHSTEIGSEYHRWWVVRNAMGSETNEHIAGLLLDGFHALLHHLVQTCGAKTYQACSRKAPRVSDDIRANRDKLSSPTSSFMASFTTSPPGVIEDIDEFMEYKSAITYYCESLWKLYGQHDSRLTEFEVESPPVYDFLVKLMAYLRAARGKNYSHKKKKLKTSSCGSNVSSGKQKSATRNNSDESDFSNDEDLTTSQQYEEQYLKMLLNKSSSSEDYNTQVTKTDHYQLHKESLNPSSKLDIIPVSELSLDDQIHRNPVKDQKGTSDGNQFQNVNEKPPNSCPPQSFTVDLQPQAVRSKKINSKTNSSKNKTSATSSVGTNTLNFAEIKPHSNSSKLKSQHNSRQNSESVSKTIQKCTGLELTIQPALPVAVDNSQCVPTPLGTPVILYPANSFPSADSSLASLSSLIQNIVCNSHGAIMKPLSSAPGFSSNATCGPSELVAHTSSCDNSICHRSFAAALPVLSSHLNAGKKNLVPFHINHMNSVNEVAKFQNVPLPASFHPSYTSTPKPIRPYLPLSQPIQPSPSTHYHGWSTTSDKNSQVSNTASSLQLLLNSTSGPPCMETRACSKSEALNYQTLFPEKNSLNPEINTSKYLSNCFLPTSITTNSVDSNYVPSENPTTKYPQKKILTSLLSSKTINYKGSSLSLLEAGNSHDNQNIGNEAKLEDKCSTGTSLPSPGCGNSTQDSVSVSLEPSMAKKKRFDKSRTHLVCSNCDLLFYSGTDLLVHRYEQHSHVCGECDGRFLSVARLKQHKESDHPVMMICSLCRFHTFNKQGLIDHQRLEHCFEIDSTEDNNTTSREVIKAASNMNLSHSGQLAHICNNEISSTSNNNNSPAISVASIKPNESVDLSVVSVSMVNRLDISTDQDCKPCSSSTTLNHPSQIELKYNHTVFLSLNREQIIRQKCDIAPANTVYENCNPGLVHSADQLYSDESDEPKLVIDTDL